MPDITEDQQTISERITIFMQSNLDKRLTLKRLSRFLGYSEKYSSELFQTYMGTTFTRYIKQLRIAKAQSMLHDESCSVAAIAKTLGFQSPFAFSHFFKKSTGRSPSAYRSTVRPTPPDRTV